MVPRGVAPPALGSGRPPGAIGKSKQSRISIPCCGCAYFEAGLVLRSNWTVSSLLLRRGKLGSALFDTRRLAATGATGAPNLAAHRCSSLLLRSIGISLIAGARVS